MNNKEIYEIADRLGMIEDDNMKCCSEDEPIDTRTDAEIFEQETSRDLINVIEFTKTLVTNNDLSTLQEFLTVVIFLNSEAKKEK